jgi:uroporphyrinogen decarboxylase
MLTHRERLHACLAGDAALDRTPVALWRHFPVDDQDPRRLAQATAVFQRTHEFDLVKVTPASSFCLKDWGVEDIWEGDSEGTRRYTKSAVEKPQDWERLKPLDPRRAPHLAAQLECLRLLRKELGPEVPLLQTIFNPFSQAKHLAGNDRFMAHLRKFPEAVLKGLEAVTETTRRFVEAAGETGIEGIFYAVQHAQAGLLAWSEYKTQALPLDLRAIEPARAFSCNLLHLHGADIYFELAAELPFAIVNWHDRETPPTLTEARSAFKDTLCGGISQKTIVLGDSAEVRREALDAMTQTKGKKFILGTGCVVPINAPYGNIQAARQSVEEKV